jgi:hypothetical protein
MPEAERRQRCLISSDQCIIDDEHFFIRGNLELPIIGSEELFVWGVWVSLSEANYNRASELLEQSGRESEPPYFGWLSTALPGYPDTVNLKTHVHTRPVGVRPSIELEPTDHLLAVEQRQGITWERIQELAVVVLHGGQQQQQWGMLWAIGSSAGSFWRRYTKRSSRAASARGGARSRKR